MKIPKVNYEYKYCEICGQKIGNDCPVICEIEDKYWHFTCKYQKKEKK